MVNRNHIRPIFCIFSKNEYHNGNKIKYKSINYASQISIYGSL
jgi:hypothetical protein